MQQFKNLKELMAYFSDERVCWDYLEKQLWDGKPVCPHCGSERVYRLANYKQFKCGNKKTCDKKFTVITGTVYQNTRIPLVNWMATIYLSACHKKGISSHQLARDLGITQRTAWYLIHRVNQMIASTNSGVLGNQISTDETYVKGKAANRTKKQKRLIAEGKRKDEAAVVLGIAEDNGKVIMKVIPNADTDTVQPVLEAHTESKKTILITDTLKIYQTIGEGLGPQSLAVIVAETNGFAAFENAAQVVSYAGYDVIENQSGKRKGKTKISKKGEPSHTALFAFSCLQHGKIRSGSI